MRIAGIDLSLTSTGVALPNGALCTIKSRDRGIERCVDVCQQIHDALRLDINVGLVDLVAIEGYSYNSQISHAHALGELGGIVRANFWSCGVEWVEVPPAVLKKYATGKGNASKDAVLVAAVQRLGITPAGNDEADAAWLRAMALDALGEPVVQVPKLNREALESVEWPKVDA